MTVATKRAIFVLFRGDFRLIWEQQIFWKADQILPPPPPKKKSFSPKLGHLGNFFECFTHRDLKGFTS